MDFDLAKFRAEKGISLHEISTKLNIPEKFLLAIEELNFDELPAPIFAKSQIKKYCSFYDLEPFGGDDQKKDVSYIENISDDQEIINDESVSETAIEKDANIPNNILENQIAFDQDPDVPTIDIDFERDDKKILSDDNVSEIEIIVQGESWVEIIDNEQILLFELLQTGLYEVTGYGPFKFKIGHSPSVKIYLNGKNIDFSETVSQYTDYAHFLFENGVVVELFKD